MKLTEKELHTLLKGLSYYQRCHAKCSEKRIIYELEIKLMKETSKLLDKRKTK